MGKLEINLRLLMLGLLSGLVIGCSSEVIEAPTIDPETEMVEPIEEEEIEPIEEEEIEPTEEEEVEPTEEEEVELAEETDVIEPTEEPDLIEPPDDEEVAERTCRVGGEHPTIQDAVDDISCIAIRIPAGTYTESVRVRRDVSIVGEGGAILDGEEQHRIFDVAGADLVLANLTLQNGYSSEGGAAIRALRSTLTLARALFQQNQANRGGAIDALSSSVSIRESSFLKNAADLGGAIWVWQGRLEVADSDFEENVAHRSGGSIATEEADLVIDTADFTSNACRGEYCRGGALSVRSSSSQSPRNVRMTGSTFQHNEVRTSGLAVGGAMAFWGDVSVTMAGVVIADNVVVSTEGLAQGGGVSFVAYGEAVTPVWNANLITVSGNAVYGQRAQGGGLYVDSQFGGSAVVFLTSSQVDDNLAWGVQTAVGGGFFAVPGIEDDTGTTVENNRVVGVLASYPDSYSQR